MIKTITNGNFIDAQINVLIDLIITEVGVIDAVGLRNALQDNGMNPPYTLIISQLESIQDAIIDAIEEAENDKNMKLLEAAKNEMNKAIADLKVCKITK